MSQILDSCTGGIQNTLLYIQHENTLKLHVHHELVFRSATIPIQRTPPYKWNLDMSTHVRLLKLTRV